MWQKLKHKFFGWFHHQLQIVQKRNRNQYHKVLKTKLAYCGAGVRFNGDININTPEQAHIEDNVHIGHGAFIHAKGGLFIGANTHISRNLVLYTASHNYLGERLPYDETYREKPVHIGRNVWIGMNVCIAPGTIIEDGAIIGIGTVVYGTIPSLAIVGASSWVQINSRDATHYQRLEVEGRYGGSNGMPMDDTTAQE